MNYPQAITYLESIERFGIQLGLRNILSLLAYLDNPHQDLKAIHIAGTNGKGSTAAFLSHILKEAGLKTGLYTSPHLLDLRERITINGAMIPKKTLVQLTTRIKPHIQRVANLLSHPTYFEVLTAIAFTYFKEKAVDLSVLEVGLGGRLDATNVVLPLISIITSIDLDHTDRLGKSLKEIAYEKAGIVKEGGVVITAEDKEEPLGVIAEVCRERGASLFRVGKTIRIEGEETTRFTVYGVKGVYCDLEINLLGRHQMTNAAIAITATELLTDYGFGLSEAHIRQGLKETTWPGRLEIVRRKPLLILDGAHNPAAAKRLVDALLADFSFERLILIVGILKDKDVEGILSPFFSAFKDRDYWVIVTQPQIDRALKVEELAGVVANFSHKFEIEKDLDSSLKRALGLAREDDLICVTGSLYTIADAKTSIKNRGYSGISPSSSGAKIPGSRQES